MKTNYDKLTEIEAVELKKKLQKLGIKTEIHLIGKYRAYAYFNGKKALITKRNGKVYITRHLQQKYKYWETINEVELLIKVRNLFKQNQFTQLLTPYNFV